MQITAGIARLKPGREDEPLEEVGYRWVGAGCGPGEQIGGRERGGGVDLSPLRSAVMVGTDRGRSG
ncbi:hypothetical protein [Streptomyces botrytidirepellens]|uniref:Uncharacterized protein n=1 Tax=Streptomyces botrytidirepellens TaxID=2486417 RepID=A0A3M8WU81_9ACTN|nr:hypothetical protein [Streptomyces botrytidirepellens]RNG33526.1 hypothetical protein EEJ42_07425 [Streptomyces botrytidirepellens]